jgi:hypothetical protein
MNIVLWIVQVLLVIMYGIAGATKAFNTAKTRESINWTEGRTDNSVRFIGTAEMLGALGMILPMLTGILPWSTPLAGVGAVARPNPGDYNGAYPEERIQSPTNEYPVAGTGSVCRGW